MQLRRNRAQRQYRVAVGNTTGIPEELDARSKLVNMTATSEQAEQLLCNTRHSPPTQVYGIKRLRKERLLDEETAMERCSTCSTTTSDAEVFCSPPEPVFNDSRRGIKPELLQQSLQSLATLNNAAVAKSSTESDCLNSFRTGNAVSFIFGLCRHFGLPADVRYRTVELFHRFMTKHIVELYEHVQATQESDSPLSWDAVEDRLRHQVSLRALTCVQLSSKMSLHYKIVGIAKARSFMTLCGFRYAASSLMQSEIRVLKTLNYRVHGPTPLDYVELIIELVGETDAVPVRQLHGVALKVLDIFYHCQGNIIKRLKKISSSSTTNSVVLDGKVAAVRADFMLLAASVVGAASFVLCQASSDYVVDIVTSSISTVHKEDILDLSALLVEQIMIDSDSRK